MRAYPLDPTLDTAAATPLRAALLARLEQRQPLVLDAAAVTRVGQACLQVLASAKATAMTDGLAFSITDPSGPLREMATLARLDALLEPVG